MFNYYITKPAIKIFHKIKLIIFFINIYHIFYANFNIII